MSSVPNLKLAQDDKSIYFGKISATSVVCGAHYEEQTIIVNCVNNLNNRSFGVSDVIAFLKCLLTNDPNFNSDNSKDLYGKNLLKIRTKLVNHLDDLQENLARIKDLDRWEQICPEIRDEMMNTLRNMVFSGKNVKYLRQQMRDIYIKY